jgi:hypothetical protein
VPAQQGHAILLKANGSLWCGCEKRKAFGKF